MTSHIMLHVFKRTMNLLWKYNIIWGCCVLLAIAGCQTVPKYEEFFQLVSLEERSIQTRIYQTDDEIKILSACTDLLLDNGFRIKEVESRLGWIDASKIKHIQYVGLFRAQASVVTRHIRGRSGAIAVRVIFHHQGKVEDPAIYQEFFLKLSQAIFLEAQQI